MDRSNIILFDGVCNLCNGLVQFMLKHDKKQVFKFASLQSDVAQKLLKDKKTPDSIIVISEDKVLDKSEAVLYICKKLGGKFTILRIAKLIPKPIRDKLYDQIAKRRYAIFGKSDSCMLPSKEEAERFIK